MKHIKEEFTQPIYESEIWNFYFDGLKVGVLDIETTGLSPAYSRFILGGFYDVSEGVMHQVFAESREEECQALTEYVRLLKEVDMVITYNGRHFDIPFLQRRLRENGICHEEMPYDLDLFPAVKYHSPLRKLLPNLKQETLENYMGFWMQRDDRITGGESIDLFLRYEETKDPKLEKLILLHNSDDVKQLARLTRVISKCDFHSAMFRQGFPAGRRFIVREIKPAKGCLTISGLQRTGERCEEPVTYMGFEFNDNCVESHLWRQHMNGSKTIPAGFELKFPLLERRAFEYEDGNLNYRDINMFVKEFLKMFEEQEL